MNEELTAQLYRTADRLRQISAAQLEREDRVATARELIHAMASRVRPGINVPTLALNALGDQLLVVGREFAAQVGDVEAEAMAQQLKEFRVAL